MCMPQKEVPSAQALRMSGLLRHDHGISFITNNPQILRNITDKGPIFATFSDTYLDYILHFLAVIDPCLIVSIGNHFGLQFDKRLYFSYVPETPDVRMLFLGAREGEKIAVEREWKNVSYESLLGKNERIRDIVRRALVRIVGTNLS
jgi:hypothetical protein